MYLTIEDYKPVCEQRELDVLQQSDADTRERAEKTALEEIAGYLRNRYNIDKEFASSGDERNPHLVIIAVNITLFYLVQWLPKKMAGAKRAELYEIAIDWLKTVQKGNAAPNLPEYTGEGDGSGGTGYGNSSYPMAIGGLPRQKYDW